MTIHVALLTETDLGEADRIFRLAFGTFLGLPDPMRFAQGADMVRTRFRANPRAALGAFDGSTLIGSNFAAKWGSFGFFGPLTIRPDYWNKGAAKQLLGATLSLFKQWDIEQAGLFTFPQSPKHVGLYQKFGFWPQQLTAVMSCPVANAGGEVRLLSKLDGEARKVALNSIRTLSDAVFAGLDLSSEITALENQSLGEVILIGEPDASAFAICHLGSNTEAGPAGAFVKFAAVHPDSNPAQGLKRLLSACASLAARRGLEQIIASVNTARHDAYRILIGAGYRTMMHGVAMQSPNAPGFNRPDAFVLDDWR